MLVLVIRAGEAREVLVIRAAGDAREVALLIRLLLSIETLFWTVTVTKVYISAILILISVTRDRAADKVSVSRAKDTRGVTLLIRLLLSAGALFWTVTAAEVSESSTTLILILLVTRVVAAGRVLVSRAEDAREVALLTRLLFWIVTVDKVFELSVILISILVLRVKDAGKVVLLIRSLLLSARALF